MSVRRFVLGKPPRGRRWPWWQSTPPVMPPAGCERSRRIEDPVERLALLGEGQAADDSAQRLDARLPRRQRPDAREGVLPTGSSQRAPRRGRSPGPAPEQDVDHPLHPPGPRVRNRPVGGRAGHSRSRKHGVVSLHDRRTVHRYPRELVAHATGGVISLNTRRMVHCVCSEHFMLAGAGGPARPDLCIGRQVRRCHDRWTRRTHSHSGLPEQGHSDTSRTHGEQCRASSNVIMSRSAV